MYWPPTTSCRIWDLSHYGLCPLIGRSVLTHIRMKYYNCEYINIIKMKNIAVTIFSGRLRKIRDPSPVSALVIRTNTVPPYLSSYYNLSLHPPSTPPVPVSVMRPRWCQIISTFLPFIIPFWSESSIAPPIPMYSRSGRVRLEMDIFWSYLRFHR